MKSSALLACALISAFLLLGHAPTSESVTCNPLALASCAGAIMGSDPQSATCCSNLKEQTPCFCQYARNPTLRPYVTSPNAKRVSSTCGVPYPSC